MSWVQRLVNELRSLVRVAAFPETRRSVAPEGDASGLSNVGGGDDMSKRSRIVLLGFILILGALPAGAPASATAERATQASSLGAGPVGVHCAGSNFDQDCPGERWSSGTKSCVCAPSGTCVTHF